MSTTSDERRARQNGLYNLPLAQELTGPKTIRDFHGDNVWHDEAGTIWMRLDESIAMQEFVWDDGYGPFRQQFPGRVNPYANALVVSPQEDK